MPDTNAIAAAALFLVALYLNVCKRSYDELGLTFLSGRYPIAVSTSFIFEYV
jgi:hypothetical protein